jgi:hypothetical protein
MVRWVAALLLLLPLVPSRADDAAGTAAAPPEQAAIDAAVARGVKWLRAEQSGGGGFGSGVGETALALLALRHSGMRPGDEAARKAARYLARRLPDGTVYGAALGILALLEQPRADHDAEVKKLVRQLARGQCRNGQWTYSYRGTARKKSGDNSNTQIAILALAAARARRYRVPAEVFVRLRAFLLESQNEDGGWGYAANQRRRSYASMTAGCAMALKLCADDKDAEAALGRAFAWLADGFDAGLNKGSARAFGTKKKRRSDATWRHYWLWSLERAGSVADVGKLGAKDWYAEGARFLLDTQRDNGEWGDPESKLQATCFALLFFARSTKAVITPRPGDVTITPGGG